MQGTYLADLAKKGVLVDAILNRFKVNFFQGDSQIDLIRRD